MTTTARTYSASLATPVGSTGTGLDQLIAWDALDGGLAGANEASAIDGESPPPTGSTGC